MLHMALACNILNALGGSPAIDHPKFIPRYPGPLPGAVEAELIVPLARFSLDLVKNIFMEIEEPEAPLRFQIAAFAAFPPQTIGHFYGTLKQQIQERGQSIFVGDRAKQVTSTYWPDELIEVIDVESATRAIEVIVEQGEGTSGSPLDLEGEMAHYYRFAEIYHGKKLILNLNAPPDASDDQKYIYGGPLIPFDPNGVTRFLMPLANPLSSDQRRGHTHDLSKHRGAGLRQRSFHEPSTHADQVKGSSDELVLQPRFRQSPIPSMT
jgi:hypothetical protein